jgi:Fur family transcriptional regulator, ferric uptake regulator
VSDQAALRSTLHQRGMRMTPQRQLVLDAVRELGHATPEQVCRRVQTTAPTVNITTVYRALDLLEELDLVRHTHLGHGAPTYSVEEHEHVHLVCHRCGRIDEVPCDLLHGLAQVLDDQYGFTLDATHLALSGTCRDCRTATGVEMSDNRPSAHAGDTEEPR